FARRVPLVEALERVYGENAQAARPRRSRDLSRRGAVLYGIAVEIVANLHARSTQGLGEVEEPGNRKSGGAHMIEREWAACRHGRVSYWCRRFAAKHAWRPGAGQRVPAKESIICERFSRKPSLLHHPKGFPEYAEPAAGRVAGWQFPPGRTERPRS